MQGIVAVWAIYFYPVLRRVATVGSVPCRIVVVLRDFKSDKD